VRKRVLITAGEASGDAYGAALAAELKKLGDVEVWAVGGVRLSSVADRMIADSTRWSAISISQSFKVGARVLLKWPAVCSAVRVGGDLHIPIDFGFVNQRIARRAKQSGWKVLSFVPPGSWKRSRQAPWIAEVCDAVSTPFDWSAKLLSEAGAKNVHWLGHPLKQLLRDRLVVGRPERHEQIAVMPGSRSHELKMNLPLIAGSIPDVPAEFALASGSDEAKFRRRWEKLAPSRKADIVTVGDSSAVLLRSRAGLICSGTATLEAALCGCPMVVIYGVSKAMEVESKIVGFKKPQFISLPNIILDRELVPELVGTDATIENIAPVTRRLLQDEAFLSTQRAGFAEVEKAMGPDDAITQTARLAMELLADS
jgi:lipid-A-disaccharide synthase